MRALTLVLAVHWLLLACGTSKFVADARSLGGAAAAGSDVSAPAARRRLRGASVVVGGNDLREVQGPLPYPFSATGLLIFADAPADSSDNAALGEHGRQALTASAICTGWLASADTVVTAAHCLHPVAGAKAGRPAGFRKVLAFLPSYSRGGGGGGGGSGGGSSSSSSSSGSSGGAAGSPIGPVEVLWTDVLPEWAAAAGRGEYQWRSDIGVLRLARPVGYKTGWFGVAGGCAVAAAALEGAPKERLGVAAGTASQLVSARLGSATASAAMAVAGYPGDMARPTAGGQLSLPLMSDRQCRAFSGNLCPADARAPPGADRMGGMLRHSCDTAKGMSGAPVWLQHGTPEAAAAGDVAAASGLPGAWPAEAGDALGGWQPMGTRPAVAVGAVSRGTGDCPHGPDCVNLAAPFDDHALEYLRAWIARK